MASFSPVLSWSMSRVGGVTSRSQMTATSSFGAMNVLKNSTAAPLGSSPST